VLSSPGGGLAEAGRDVAELVDAMDPGAWADAVLRHRGDAAFHSQAVERSRGAPIRTWSDTATDLAEILTGLIAGDRPDAARR
jgi:hypothetical protein